MIQRRERPRRRCGLLIPCLIVLALGCLTDVSKFLLSGTPDSWRVLQGAERIRAAGEHPASSVKDDSPTHTKEMHTPQRSVDARHEPIISQADGPPSPRTTPVETQQSSVVDARLKPSQADSPPSPPAAALLPPFQQPSDQPLFLVLGDSRSGAGWFFQSLVEHHPHVCGSLETVSLIPPPGLTWIPDGDERKQCSLAYWLDRTEQLRQQVSCDKSADFLCSVAQNSTATVSQQFVDHYRSASLLDCFTCPDTTRTRGLHLLGAWGEQLPEDLTTSLTGNSKVIRFHRRNRVAHFLSYQIAQATNEWNIREAQQKRSQLEKVPSDFHVSMEEMNDNVRFLVDQEHKGDAWARELASSDTTLHLDYEYCQVNLKACLEQAYAFLGVEASTATSVVAEESFPDTNELLQHVSNADVVREYWAAHQMGYMVGIGSYAPIQYLTASGDRREPRYPGITTTTFVSESFIDTLKTLPPNALVLADHGVSRINPYLTTMDSLLEAVAAFRKAAAGHPVMWLHDHKGGTVSARDLVVAHKDPRSMPSGVWLGIAKDLVAALDTLNGHESVVVVDEANEQLFGRDVFPECEATRRDASLVRSASAALFVRGEKPSDCFAKSDFPNYPIWGRREDGLPFDPILAQLKSLSNDGNSIEGVDRFFGAEIPYIVDRAGISVSKRMLETVNEETMIHRIGPTDKLLIRVSEMLGKDTSANWPLLKKSMESGGFPYFAWYGDFKGCNTNNIGTDSIPLFTTCAAIGCEHAFPFPTYMTIVNAQPSSEDWLSEFFPKYERTYPWESKTRKVVWRGSLSESVPAKVYDSQRWRVAKHAFESQHKDLYDVGLVSVPSFLTDQMDIDVSEVGGLYDGILPQEDFQKYMAVLDLDGNSWSSRFGSMLCYNSVIVKVEPAYVDYFYGDLVPWKHYIPVKDDLSDLDEIMTYITNPENDTITRSIIANANQWCTQRLVTDELAADVLDIFEEHVRLLDTAMPNWSEQWQAEKQQLSSALDFQLI